MSASSTPHEAFHGRPFSLLDFDPQCPSTSTSDIVDTAVNVLAKKDSDLNVLDSSLRSILDDSYGSKVDKQNSPDISEPHVPLGVVVQILDEYKKLMDENAQLQATVYGLQQMNTDIALYAQKLLKQAASHSADVLPPPISLIKTISSATSPADDQPVDSDILSSDLRVSQYVSLLASASAQGTTPLASLAASYDSECPCCQEIKQLLATSIATPTDTSRTPSTAAESSLSEALTAQSASSSAVSADNDAALAADAAISRASSQMCSRCSTAPQSKLVRGTSLALWIILLSALAAKLATGRGLMPGYDAT
jgi:hypothetical protein